MEKGIRDIAEASVRETLASITLSPEEKAWLLINIGSRYITNDEIIEKVGQEAFNKAEDLQSSPEAHEYLIQQLIVSTFPQK